MPPQPLTQAAVDKLTSSSRALIADGGCKGLYVDVRPNGKTYRYRYTDEAGQARAVTIGDASLLKLAEARGKMRDLARRVILGENLQAKPAAPAPSLTFGEFVAARYIPHAKLTKRGLPGELSLLKNHILPVFAARHLSVITKGEVTAFVHSKLADGCAPGTVNRMLNLVKAIFSRAVEWDVAGVEKNPAHGVKQLPDPHRKERFLTPDEARRLMNEVMGSENPLLAPIVAFLLLTGARKREALDARWEHIDFDRQQWTVPLSKSGKPRHIPLSDGAIQVLAQAKALVLQQMGQAGEGCPWVFPNPDTGKPFATVYISWNTARTKAGLRDVRMHDLRHSFASALVNRGMTLYDVKELLGHSSMTTTQRYAHLAPGRLMQAASEAAAHYALPAMGAALPAPGTEPAR